MPTPRPTRLKLFLLERLKPGELQRTLLVAAVIGVLGALATVGFRELLGLLERLLFRSDSRLVQTAARLAWWQRILYPCAGGIAAGLVLREATRLRKCNAAGRLHGSFRAR
jgi:CIC family chloride channel protein